MKEDARGKARDYEMECARGDAICIEKGLASRIISHQHCNRRHCSLCCLDGTLFYARNISQLISAESKTQEHFT